MRLSKEAMEGIDALGRKVLEVRFFYCRGI